MNRSPSKVLLATVLATVLLAGSHAGFAQDSELVDSPVWRVIYYKFKPGKAGAWWQDIQNVFVPVSELGIERGLFNSYKLFENPYKNSPDDWDVMLMIEYANYSALDRFYREAGELYVELFPDAQTRAEMFARRSTLHDVVRIDLVTERKFGK